MSNAATLTGPVPAPAAPTGRNNPLPEADRVGQVSEGLRRWRKFKSGFISALCLVCAVLVVTPLALVFGYLVIKGAGSINLDFFIKTPVSHGEVGGGVAQAIVGSMILVGVAALVGLPTGVLAAVYITEYAGQRFASLVRFSADLLNGVPSIVWGIVGYAIFVLKAHSKGDEHEVVLHGVLGHMAAFYHKISPFSQGSYSAIAGALVLAFIMIPLVMRTTEEVLLLVPNGYREAALALGIARWKIVTHIVVKTAAKGILTGALLAVARVSGETAPLLFTTLGNSGWSHSLKDPMAALPLQIYNYSISPYPDENRQAWAAALVLLTLVLVLNVGLRYATRERSGRSNRGNKAANAAATAAVTGGAVAAAQT